MNSITFSAEFPVDDSRYIEIERSEKEDSFTTSFRFVTFVNTHRTHWDVRDEFVFQRFFFRFTTGFPTLAFFLIVF